MKETLIQPVLDGYEPEVGAALWRLEEARSRTLRVLENVPDRIVDDETNGNTIGTILYHLALIEADWLHTEILEQPIPDALKVLLPVEDRDAEGVLLAVRGQTLDEHRARLRAVRELVVSSLRGMRTGDFHRARELPNYDVSPAWVLHHLSQHEAEHRGELGSVVAALGAQPSQA